MKGSSMLFTLSAAALITIACYEDISAKVSFDAMGIVFALYLCSAFICKAIENK
jgi:hypothetical protein